MNKLFQEYVHYFFSICSKLIKRMNEYEYFKKYYKEPKILFLTLGVWPFKDNIVSKFLRKLWIFISITGILGIVSTTY